MSSLIILVPIYKATLDALEQFSLDHSVAALDGREIVFIGPDGLDISYYSERYPGRPFRAYDPHYFASIKGYNHLLLAPAFYKEYANYEFMLILQTDAIILRDELDWWCAQPFDYVGAPWPEAVEVIANAGRFEGSFAKHLRAHVGNGGLSLRRIRKCLSLLEEHAIYVEIFEQSGSSEDLFFSLMGQLSNDFIMPNEITASRFAMELRPSYYSRVNGGVMPMGGHAWWKYEIGFWQKLLPEMPVVC